MLANSSSKSSLHPLLDNCLNNRRGIINYTAIVTVNIIFLLPLFILVLYVGYQKWRKQRSGATAVMSHSDIFTFHMVAMEIISIIGSLFYLYGVHTNCQGALKAGSYIFSIITPGQLLFHLLTCVERYLAVVHPVTYMGLKQSGGVRIRKISIGCVWLLCFGSINLSIIKIYFYDMYILLLLGVSSVVISSCSLLVLWVLIRTKPGEVCGNRGRVDQLKQRAFYTIMVIMGALLLRFFTSVASTATKYLSVLSISDKCLVMISSIWVSMPSSLVLPLLFLQRAGKLPSCKHKTESG